MPRYQRSVDMASSNSFPQTVEKIRVLVADGTRMGTQLLSEALERSGRFGVTASSAASSELLSALGESRPHVVILSPELDGEEGRGFSITRQLRTSYPDIKVTM